MEAHPMTKVRHQYIERHTGRVLNERLYGDKVVNLLYSGASENPCLLFKSLTGARMSSLLGFINYDMLLGAKFAGSRSFPGAFIDWSECVDGPETFKSLREVF